MTDADRRELELRRIVHGPVTDRVEWSGVVRGPGWGPHGSGNDGDKFPACPVCRGLEKPNGQFIGSAVGHRPGCRLAKFLGSPTVAESTASQEEEDI